MSSLSENHGVTVKGVRNKLQGRGEERKKGKLSYVPKPPDQTGRDA